MRHIGAPVMRANATARGIRTLDVTYEDLVAHKAKGLKRVADFVLAEHAFCYAGEYTYAHQKDETVRLHAESMSDYITNWGEIVETLRGTRFEYLLTLDGSKA